MDSWDNEYAYLNVDGVRRWDLYRTDYNTCNNGWSPYSGSFPNPWNGDDAWDKCYYDVDVTVPHTASSLLLRIGSTIDSPTADESWGFSKKEVKLGDGDAPVAWYKPKDSETYRVVYGDLSVKDVAEKDLPKEESEGSEE